MIILGVILHVYTNTAREPCGMGGYGRPPSKSSEIPGDITMAKRQTRVRQVVTIYPLIQSLSKVY